MNLLCQKLMIGSWSLCLLLLGLPVSVPNIKDCLTLGHPGKLNSSTPRFTSSQLAKPRKEIKFLYPITNSRVVLCCSVLFLLVCFVSTWRYCPLLEKQNKTKQSKKEQFLIIVLTWTCEDKRMMAWCSCHIYIWS